MNVNCFEDTDRCTSNVVMVRSLDRKASMKNSELDLNVDGYVCAVTFEHTSRRADVHNLTIEGIAA